MTFIDKDQTLKEVIAILEGNLEVLVKSALEAKEFSTNEESKAENKYDTRGLEASYLASGQAQRAQKLQEQIYLLKKVNLKKFSETDKIGMGAMVHLLVDEKLHKYLFILPSGGVDLEVAGTKIQTITIESPIGTNLHEQVVEHEFEINGKVYEIIGVQ